MLKEAVMDEKIQKLKELLMEVTILYFLAEQEFPQKVVFRILEVWTDYTIRNMIIHRKQFKPYFL